MGAAEVDSSRNGGGGAGAGGASGATAVVLRAMQGWHAKTAAALASGAALAAAAAPAAAAALLDAQPAAAAPEPSAATATADLPQQQQQQQRGVAAPPHAEPGPPEPGAFARDLHGPVAVRAAPHVSQALRNALSARHRTVPINDPSHPVEYETDLFEGRALVLLRHLPSSPSAPFEGKRRTCFVAVQGRFKRPVRCDALVMGADFQRPLRLPPKLFLAGTRLGGWIARRAGGDLQVRLRGARPFAHSRVITAAQAVHAAAPGEAPPGLLEAAEDCRALDPACADDKGAPLCMGRRRAHFNRGGRARTLFFSPDCVYTFTFWNQEMDYSTFRVRGAGGSAAVGARAGSVLQFAAACSCGCCGGSWRWAPRA